MDGNSEQTTCTAAPQNALLALALRRDRNLFLLHLFYAIFAAFTLFIAFYHTPWRDEGIVWLTARALGPWELFKEVRHQGHPALWYYCLQGLQAVGAGFQSMLVLNWAFLVGGMWLLCYRSALPLVIRLGALYAPIALFHMPSSARNYTMAIPLFFGAAMLYRQAREGKALLFSVLLALLASTNVYAAAVFVGISFQFLLEQTSAFGREPFSLRPLYTRFLLPNLILLLGALLLVAQLIPVSMAGDPPQSAPLMEFHRGQVQNMTLLVPLTLLLSLALFARRSQLPRIYGGWPSVILILVPAVVYVCLSRHIYMGVLGILYFIWISYDEWVEGRQLGRWTLSREATRLAICFVALLGCFIIYPGGVKKFFSQWAGARLAFQLEPQAFDSTGAGRSIREHGLDTAETILIPSDPTKVSSLLLHLKQIQSFQAPPPYEPGPQLFTDIRRAILATIPTLVELEPFVVQIARANPNKQILMVGSDSRFNAQYTMSTPGYAAEPIYQSAGTGDVITGELFQVYLLKQTAPAQ